MSAITAAQRTIQTELIRTRLRQLDPSPMATMDALLVIETMILDEVLHADFALMTMSTLQLLKLEGLVK